MRRGPTPRYHVLRPIEDMQELGFYAWNLPPTRRLEEVPGAMSSLERNSRWNIHLSRGARCKERTVYNTQGENLGEVYDVMIDKVSGKIAYAVMSFGGFLGIGNRYHPLPWSTLKYDTRQQGLCGRLNEAAARAGSHIRGKRNAPLGATERMRRTSTTTTKRPLTGQACNFWRVNTQPRLHECGRGEGVDASRQVKGGRQ